MKSAFGRLLLRVIGRSYEVLNPESLCGQTEYSLLTDAAVVSSGCCSSTIWKFTPVSLRAGWYMLEIEHGSDSIGCVLTLLPTGSDTSHLRLGSKKVCKRIVWFAGMVSELAVSIDQPNCTLKRLTLVALSSHFVMSRIRQRLENRGNLFPGSVGSAADIYQLYQARLHDSIFSKPYRYVERDVEQGGMADSLIVAKRASVHLKLQRVSADDAVLCHSVEKALDFARNLGWVVDWQSRAEPMADGSSSEGKKVYLMPVQSEVRYRLDVIHQLLSAVSEDTVIVYADHDHVDEHGWHHDPILKPDWNPELLLNFNYIDLPWIVSESWFGRVNAGIPARESREDALLLAAALGRRVATDGVDVCMTPIHGRVAGGTGEFVAALSNDQVKHVPDILASRNMRHAPFVPDATVKGSHWQRSIEQALESGGADATVSCGKLANLSRVSWNLPADLPAVDIIIPTRDKVDVLQKCVESLQVKTRYPNFRIIIVDNNSCETETEQYYQSLDGDERVTLLRYTQTFNYSAINNFAVDRTGAPVLVLLNNDTEVISCNWLDELVRQVLRPEVGCVGAKLYYSNGRIQHAGVVVGVAGIASHAFRYERGAATGYCGRLQASQNYTAVTAACMAVKRETYLKVGGFDQKHLSIAWNDVDFCMKVQSTGLRNVWTPFAELFHHEGLSRGSDDTSAQRQRVMAERSVMMERWVHSEYRDPAYHPLLTRDNENFGLGNTVT